MTSIESTLHEVFIILRDILSNEGKIVTTIDNSFEKVVMSEVRLIPKDVGDKIVVAINILRCVNYVEVFKILRNSNLKVLDYVPNFNSKEHVNKLIKTQVDAKYHSLINNVLRKLGPLFTCVDYIVKNQERVNDRLIEVLTSRTSIEFDGF